MAIAVMILSTEGGRNTVTTVAASASEAVEAEKVLGCCPERKHFGIETEQAIKYFARAWDVIGQKWEQEHKGKVAGQVGGYVK